MKTNLIGDVQIRNFEDLLKPNTFQDFVQNYWEHKSLVVERDDRNYYRSLLSIENIDHILDNGRPSGSSLKVVKNQESLSPVKYENSDGSLNINQLYVSYAEGYTIVLNEVERFWQPIKILCQNLEGTFSHKTVANLYLTPKNQKALMPHYDTHDVYVIQIQGKKNWKLYDANYRTPILNSFQPIFQREQLKGVKEFTVNAGDMLYIPRGL